MLNKIFLMGRLTRDPELRRTQTGTPVASFSLAVDRDFKDKATGERSTDFIDVVADKDGGKRRSAEVIADQVYFGDSKRDSDGGGYSNAGYASGGGYSGGYAAPSAPAPSGYGAPSGGDQFAELSDDDGELPF